jgi:hypothetical protein
MNFFFTLSSCVISRLFWNTFMTFLEIFICHCDLIFCKWKIYHVFNMYLDYHKFECKVHKN